VRHLGLATEVPEPRSGRAPPLPLEIRPLHDDADVAAFGSSA
jgi:hypothetical protein